MPRVKLQGIKPNYQKFCKSIQIRMLEQDQSIESVAAKMGRSQTGVRNWIKNPEEIRLKDLADLFMALHFSHEERVQTLSELISVMGRS